MRRVDAPPAGWYPDPESRTRLRWWDGEDWANIRRAPPSQAELTRYEEAHPAETTGEFVAAGRQFTGGEGSFSRRDADQIISEVRNVARAEIDRAAEVFSQRATHAARSFTPLITEYTSKVLRWVKIATTIAVLLLVLWLAFQIFAQASLFEWIGDRIDNLTNPDENGVGTGWIAVS